MSFGRVECQSFSSLLQATQANAFRDLKSFSESMVHDLGYLKSSTRLRFTPRQGFQVSIVFNSVDVLRLVRVAM